jgi:NitT/TauT family transport system ATP-binding protein/nitrate/nitrite transport system substrate-binding protein
MPSLRLGLLRLTDSAPVVLAHETGIFAREGLDIALSVEPSWANIADKLSYKALDAAVMLPPLALSVALGYRAAATPLLVPMGLSLNGNAVTLASAVAETLLDGGPHPALVAGRRLHRMLPGRKILRLAVVHARSTHDLLLRYWLAASGFDLEREVTIQVIPPAEMVAALGAGKIDGFCAGAPWGAMALRAGIGRIVIDSAAIWRRHPEKCLAVRQDWAEARPELLQSLLRALLLAAQYADDPIIVPLMAKLLSSDRYVGVPAEVIAESLPGGDGGASIFFGQAATYPWRSHARWFLSQMIRWGDLPADLDVAAAASVYRPDLYRDAAGFLGLPLPLADGKQEGGHEADWQIPAMPAPIQMAPDPFCDGACFAV